MTAKVKKTMKKELRQFRANFIKEMNERRLSDYDRELIEMIMKDEGNNGKL